MPPLEKRRTIDSRRLDLVERDRRAAGDELEQVAQLERLAAVDELRERVVAVAAGDSTACAARARPLACACSASTTSGLVACGSPPLRNLT